MEAIEIDTKKQKDTHVHGLENHYYFKISILPKDTHRINAMPINIPKT